MSIASEINLDLNQMQQDDSSVFAITYQDENFAYQSKRYCVDKLVLIGWLLCFHQSKEIQIDELWDIINPNFKEYVDKDYVMKYYEDLIYIAVNLN